jgi:hypothetical protein
METVIPTTPAEESIPRSVVPWARDDDKSRYLGLRASGFTVREALGLIGKAKSTLSLWRHTPEFVALETKLPELRRELALEYANLEFLRNYRLVLEKDYRVLRASLSKKVSDDGKPVGMESQDFQYLLRMRAHYTPQQLQVIETLLTTGKDGQRSLNLTDFVLTMSRTKDEVKIETRHKQPAELSPVFDPDEAEGGLTIVEQS